MSLERYRDLVEMGAPEVPAGCRYVVSDDPYDNDLYVHIEQNVTYTSLFGKIKTRWKPIGRTFSVSNHHMTTTSDWEIGLVQAAGAAVRSAEYASLAELFHDKWEGTHP